VADEVNREMRENCTGSANNAILKILEAAREVPHILAIGWFFAGLKESGQSLALDSNQLRFDQWDLICWHFNQWNTLLSIPSTLAMI